MRSRRGADIALDHPWVVFKRKLKQKKDLTTGQTATRKFIRHPDKLKGIKITLKNSLQALQDPLKKRQLQRDHRSTNFKVSEVAGPQKEPS
ncbi:unnamed protein product [Schistosoma margrebowiei]|uniref:Uncharacterized protein n=1 Tax=Schistosoma margrebowiei TaxID=48269 RepID=A0A183MGF3_9TREM|nr:unnamed protein product [Schistosoma margrebowiei]